MSHGRSSAEEPGNTRRERACPWCAESILEQAVLCRFCGRDVPLAVPCAARAERTARASRPERSRVGIGGWLLLFIVSQCLILAGAASALTNAAIADALAQQQSSGTFALLFGHRALYALLIATTIAILSTVVRKRSYAPSLVLRLLGAMTLLHWAALFVEHEAAAHIGYVPDLLELFIALARSAVYLIGWGLYWRRSVRVRNTFGSNASWLHSPNQGGHRVIRGTGVATAGLLSLVLVVAIGTALSGKARIADLADGELQAQASADIETVSAGPVETEVAMPRAERAGENPLAERAATQLGQSPPTARPARAANSSADEAMMAAIRSQGVDADSLIEALDARGDSRLVEFASVVVVTDLTHAERREVAHLRAAILERMETAACARFVRDGSGSTAGLLSDAEFGRLIKLSGLAMGRRAGGRYRSEMTPTSEDRVLEILAAHGNESNVDKIVNGISGSASDPQTCEGGKLLYQLILDIPASTRDSRDAVYWLLDILSARS